MLAWFLTTGLVVFIAQSASSAEDYKSIAQYKAIAKAFRVTSVVTADIDEDLVEEVAIAYRTSSSSATGEGGLLILKPVGGQYRPVYHVFFDSTYASQIKADKGRIGFLFIRSGPTGDEELGLTWSYGKQFVFNDHTESVLFGARTTCSSRAKGTESSDVIDLDLDTAWAEGVGGTGVGESVTVKLKKPISVGLVGLFPGKSLDRKAFKRANRVHRATLEIQTESDVGDEASALDFSDLGIDIGGDTEELAFSNAPQFKYFKIKRRKALNLVVKIDSVYLGDKEDDTYVAEFEIVPMIPRSETIDRAKKITPKKAGSTGAPKVSGKVIEE